MANLLYRTSINAKIKKWCPWHSLNSGFPQFPYLLEEGDDENLAFDLPSYILRDAHMKVKKINFYNILLVVLIKILIIPVTKFNFKIYFIFIN